MDPTFSKYSRALSSLLLDFYFSLQQATYRYEYLQAVSQKSSFDALFSFAQNNIVKKLESSFESRLVTSRLASTFLLRLLFFSSPRLLPFSTSLLSLDVDAEFHPLGIQTLTLSVPRLASSLTVAVSSNTHNHNFV
jgi:hypothetical protein